jgi:hypothetical protein
MDRGFGVTRDRHLGFRGLPIRPSEEIPERKLTWKLREPEPLG